MNDKNEKWIKFDKVQLIHSVWNVGVLSFGWLCWFAILYEGFGMDKMEAKHDALYLTAGIMILTAISKIDVVYAHVIAKYKD